MARRTRAVIPPSVYKTIFQSLIKQPFKGFLLIYDIWEIVDNPNIAPFLGGLRLRFAFTIYVNME